MNNYYRFLWLLVSLTLGLMTTTQAATFTVTTTADGGAGSLRQAITDAQSSAGPDVIQFTAGLTGTISLTSALPDIVDDITFLGPGAANLTVRRSSGTFRIFNIPNNNTVSFDGFTIADGSAVGTGGGINNAGRLTITNCIFLNNQATTNGGGVSNTNQLIVTNTLFTGNTAFFGGSIYNSGGSSTLTSCSLTSNQAINGGGAIYNINHTATLSSCVIQSNSAPFGVDGGGGIYNSGGSSTLTSCSLTSNQAINGGAIYNTNSHTATLSSCVIQSNTATSNGGGISNGGGSSTLTSCSLTNNQATNGGAIFNDTHTATLNRCVIQSNTATINGGGIANEGGSSSLTSCSLTSNQGRFGGGAIYNINHTATLSRCVIQSNSAPGSGGVGGGGGIANEGGSSTLTSCSLTSNQAINGGATYNLNHTATLNSCVIQSNAADRRGGGILSGGGSSTLTSCSLTNNQAIFGGGAIANDFHTATLSSCVIQSNSATNSGGGILSGGGSSTLTSCSLTNNQADNGGAIFNNRHTATLSSCVIQSNSATNSGGGIFNFESSSTLVNVAFINNQTTNQGGAIHNDNSSPTLTNVSFRGNTAAEGTVFYIRRGTTQLTNGVMFGNGDPNNSIAGDATLQASYSLFEVGITSYTSVAGNLTTAVSPFVSTTGVALNACAPAINAGNSVSYTAASFLTVDLAGNPRIVGASIDMGAVEFQSTVVLVAISTQPAAGSAVCPGDNVSVSVNTTGTAVSYQWYKGSSILTGNTSATTATLSIPAATTQDAGSYSVVVTGTCLSVTSTAFSLTINPIPTITISANPALNILTGQSATLTASGASSYNWSNSASTTAITVSVAGPYSVTGTTNGCSGTATVTVNTFTILPPSITAQPVSASTICVGASVVVTVGVSGSISGFQWLKGGSPVAGQTTATLSLGSVQVGDAGVYSLSLTGPAGNATSSNFTLMVNPLPVVTLTIPVGTTAQGSGGVALITLPPNGFPTTFQASGGSSYERVIILDRVNGFEVRQVDNNTTGIFPINRLGLFALTVTGAGGCQRTVQWVVQQ